MEKKFKSKKQLLLGPTEKTLRPNIVFIWSNWIVAILQSILFFDNMFKMPTHIQIRYNKDQDISAEPGGVQLVSHKDINTYRRSEVYEAPVELSGDKLTQFYQYCQQFMGGWYDYYIYLRWHLHVSIAYVPGFLFLGWLIFKWYPFKIMVIYALGYFILAVIIDLILKWLSKKTWHCTELSSTIYKKIGIDFGYDDNEKSAPLFNLKMVQFAEWKKLYFHSK